MGGESRRSGGEKSDSTKGYYEYTILSNLRIEEVSTKNTALGIRHGNVQMKPIIANRTDEADNLIMCIIKSQCFGGASDVVFIGGRESCHSKTHRCDGAHAREHKHVATANRPLPELLFQLLSWLKTQRNILEPCKIMGGPAT